MKLKDLPDEAVRIGMRVWNYHKTQQGSITRLWLDPDGLNTEITWDDGAKSDYWNALLDLEIVSE